MLLIRESSIYTHRHPGEGRGPEKIKRTWIPAFAGMTTKKDNVCELPDSSFRIEKQTLSTAATSGFFLSASSAHSAVHSCLTQPLLISLLKDLLGREHPVYGRGKSRVHSHLDDDFNNLLA
jgi:hypothetical protein